MTVLEFLASKSTVSSGTAYDIVSGVGCNGVSDGIDIISMEINENEIIDITVTDREAIVLKINEIEIVEIDLT